MLLSRATNIYVNSKRKWHPRRISISKDIIYLSHPQTTKIVDAIPLFELEEIFFMHDDSKDSATNVDETPKNHSADTRDGSFKDKLSDAKSKKTGNTNKLKFSFSFQLRTTLEGYNSGRQYIIQAGSDEESQALVTNIRRLAKVSRENYLAKSKFLKAQVPPLCCTHPLCSIPGLSVRGQTMIGRRPSIPFKIVGQTLASY